MAGSCFIKRMLQRERGKNRTKHPVGAVVLLGAELGMGMAQEPSQEQERKTHLCITREPKLPCSAAPSLPAQLSSKVPTKREESAPAPGQGSGWVLPKTQNRRCWNKNSKSPAGIGKTQTHASSVMGKLEVWSPHPCRSPRNPWMWHSVTRWGLGRAWVLDPGGLCCEAAAPELSYFHPSGTFLSMGLVSIYKQLAAQGYQVLNKRKFE